MRGIKGLVNRLVVVPASSADDVRPRIVRALHHDADVDARGLNVIVSGTTVTLTGTVRSWHERESAERAAMHTPGITHVDNLIAVEWPEEEDPRARDEMTRLDGHTSLARRQGPRSVHPGGRRHAGRR